MSFGQRTARNTATHTKRGPTLVQSPIAPSTKPSTIGKIHGEIKKNGVFLTVIYTAISFAVVTLGGALVSGGWTPPGVRVSDGKPVLAAVVGKTKKTKIVNGKPTDVYIVYVMPPNSIYQETITVTKERWDAINGDTEIEIK
jgi:hypothetical protein